MRLPPALVLAGVARTLEEDVLPAVADRAARGLVFTALEVLANVQDLVEWRSDVRDEELTGAATALAETAGRLEAIGLTAEGAGLRRALTAALAIPERERRGQALDRVLVDALVAADGAYERPGPEDGLASVRPGTEDALAPVRTHLVNQSLRDLMRTQRPLLNRISQG